MASRIPGQVVVKYGVEQSLHVDSFAKAIGADKNTGARLRFLEFHNPGFTVVGGKKPGNAAYGHVFAQATLQLFREILCGVNETAEHNRVESLIHEIPDQAGRFYHFRVAVSL